LGWRYSNAVVGELEDFAIEEGGCGVA